MSISVSIIMPVYNCARYLHEALVSIQAQSLTDWELIAIDDGSKDNSLEILKIWAKKDSRIRIIAQQHSGIVIALNKGIKIAQGKYLARMDGDDIALPERLKQQNQFLDYNENIVAVGTSVLFIDEAGLPIFTYYRSPTHEAIVTELLIGNGGALIHPSVMVRLNILRKIGGYRQGYDGFEDLDLYYRLSHQGHLANLPQVFLKYRQHFRNTYFSQKRSRKKSIIKSVLINDFRRDHSLSSMQIESLPITTTRLETYHMWAHLALVEKFHQTVFKYTLRAIFEYPLQKQAWRFLKYAIVFWIKFSFKHL